jgi:hypothetical protein
LFPYRHNIGVVLAALMEKDRIESLNKRKAPKAPLRLVDPHR